MLTTVVAAGATRYRAISRTVLSFMVVASTSLKFLSFERSCSLPFVFSRETDTQTSLKLRVIGFQNNMPPFGLYHRVRGTVVVQFC